MNALRLWLIGFLLMAGLALPAAAQIDPPLAGNVTGTVYQADGLTPIANATVTLILSNGTVVTSAIAGPDGAYSLSAAAGSYKIFAEAPGYTIEYWDNKTSRGAGNALTVTEGGTLSNINFSLAANGTITGLVRRTNGVTPLAGATVEARLYSSGALIASTTTDALGAYTFSLAAASYRVQAFRTDALIEYYNEQSSSGTANPVVVTAGGTSSNINFTLALTASLTGKVTRVDGTTPISGATVRALNSVSGATVRSTTTAADGTYTIDLLTPGTYKAQADVSGFTTEYYNEKATVGTANTLTLTDGETRANINFTLSGNGAVTGTVRRASDSAAISGAQVTLLTTVGALVNSTTSAADGSYTFNNVSSGSYKVLAAAATYQSEYYLNRTTLETADAITVAVDATISGVDFTLGQTGAVSGRVTNASGTGIDGATVQVQTSGGALVTVGTTNSTGDYTITNVQPGVYKINAQATGFATEYYLEQPVIGTATDVTISGGATTTNINFTLTGFATFSGTVADSSGVPLSGATVAVLRASDGIEVGSAISNDVGAYSLQVVEGTYIARASRTSYLTEYYDNKPNAELATQLSASGGTTLANINFSLDATGRILGTVIGPVGLSAPVPGAIVSLIGVGNVAQSYPSVVSAASGTFAFTNIAPGTYLLRAASTSYGTVYYNGTVTAEGASTFTITPGAAFLSTVVQFLPTANTVSGTVSASSGVIPSGGSVDLVEIDAGLSRNGVIAAGGAFSVPDVPAGRYRIRFVVPGFFTEYYNDVYSLDVGSAVVIDGSRTLNITLDPSGTVSGQVFAPNGTSPIVNHQVRWVANNHDSTTACTNGSGAFTLTGVPTNALFTIEVEGDMNCNGVAAPYVDQVYQNGLVQAFAPGATAISGINFTLASGGTISGSLLAPGGASGIGAATLAFYDVNQVLQGEATTTFSGSYTSPQLLPGAYLVYFKGDGYFLPEYYNDAAAPGAATLVTVTAGADTPNITLTANAPASGTGRISGTLYQPDGVTPDSSTLLNLYRQDGDALTLAVQTAPSIGGEFSYNTLVPGTYYVQAVPDNFPTEWYGNAATAPGTAIVVTTGQVNISITLDVGYTVSGLITDANSGQPWNAAEVTLVDALGSPIAPPVLTNNGGIYRIPVRPGTYRAYAEQTPLGARRYHPAALTLSAGSAFTVASAPLTGIDIVLGRWGEIAGIVSDSGTGVPLGNTAVIGADESGGLAFTTCTDRVTGQYRLTQAWIDATGTVVSFDPDSTACTAAVDDYREEFWQEATARSGATPLVLPQTRRFANAINLTLGAGDRLIGTVVLEGRPTKPNARWSVPLSVRITPQGGGAPVFDGTAMSDASGVFVVDAPIAPGTYTVRVKHSHTLATTQSVTVIAGDTLFTTPALREGDANNDNVVNITDFSILAQSFGVGLGAPLYDARADFNLDTVVNISDFSLLAANFGLAGAP